MNKANKLSRAEGPGLRGGYRACVLTGHGGAVLGLQQWEAVHERCREVWASAIARELDLDRKNPLTFLFHRLLLGLDGWGKFDDHT